MSDKIYDVIVVGGGPAGCAAAIYAARKSLKTLLITEEFGGQSLVSDDIQNWISEKHISGLDLAKNLEQHVRNFPDNLEIKSPEKVTSIITVDCSEARRFCDFQVTTEQGNYQAKALVIGLGAKRRRLEVAGEDKYQSKGVIYCSTCDAPLFAGKKVVVVGGGNSGIEAVQDLLSYASEVYLLEFTDSLKADPVTVQEVKNNPKLKSIILNVQVKEIVGEALVTGIRYQDKGTNQEKELAVEGVFVEIGSVPNTDVLKGLVQLDKYGQIIINARTGATSHPGVFAAGDITDIPYKQNNIAAGDGIKAALSAYDYLLNRQARGYTSLWKELLIDL